MNEMMSNQRNGSDTLQRSATPALIRMPRTPLKDPAAFSDRTSWFGIEYGYDDYGPLDPNDPNPYGKSNVYDNLHVENVDLKALLQEVFRCLGKDIPDRIMLVAEQKGWGEASAYRAVAEAGYYGEEATVRLPSDFFETLGQEYWNLPNAADDEGVLEYLRSKGYKTAGFAPVEALKAQLMDEFEVGFLPDLITQQTVVERISLPMSQLSLNNRFRTDEIVAAEPVAAENGSDTILGVVANWNGTFQLVDGFRRLKWVQENVGLMQESFNRTKGTFLLLTTLDNRASW